MSGGTARGWWLLGEAGLGHERFQDRRILLERFLPEGLDVEANRGFDIGERRFIGIALRNNDALEA